MSELWMLIPALPIVIMIWSVRWVLQIFMNFLTHSEG